MTKKKQMQTNAALITSVTPRLKAMRFREHREVV